MKIHPRWWTIQINHPNPVQPFLSLYVASGRHGGTWEGASDYVPHRPGGPPQVRLLGRWGGERLDRLEATFPGRRINRRFSSSKIKRNPLTCINILFLPFHSLSSWKLSTLWPHNKDGSNHFHIYWMTFPPHDAVRCARPGWRLITLMAWFHRRGNRPIGANAEKWYPSSWEFNLQKK